MSSATPGDHAAGLGKVVAGGVRGERVREHTYTHESITYGVRLERLTVGPRSVDLRFTAAPITEHAADPIRLRLILFRQRPPDAHLLRTMDDSLAQVLEARGLAKRHET